MIRLQTYIARCGVCSRRQAEKLITAGEVSVNNKLIKELGTKIDPENDLVTVNEKMISQEQKKRYILLNKPEGILSSAKDERGRKSVISLIKEIPERLYPVGRLDVNSSGLILLTNDGRLANALMHPRYEVEKEYQVTLDRDPTESEIKTIESGIYLEDGKTAPASIQKLKSSGNPYYSITLKEGKKREIRRMFSHFDIKVKKLRRIRMDGLKLGALKKGDYRELTPYEIKKLKKSIPQEEMR